MKKNSYNGDPPYRPYRDNDEPTIHLETQLDRIEQKLDQLLSQSTRAIGIPQ